MNVVFDFIRQIFAVPMGFILNLFYTMTGNYIWAIVLLTVVVKLSFLPAVIKRQKGQVDTAVLNEKIKQLKAQYADDPEALKKETKALRDREGGTKANIGCLTSIVQFVVLIGLFNVIYTPLTNVLGVEKATISKMEVIMEEAIENSNLGSNMLEITLMKEAGNFKDVLLEGDILTESELTEIVSLGEQYMFVGIDLAKAPSFKEVDELWLVPLFVLASGLLTPVYGFIRRRRLNPSLKKFAAIEAVPIIPPMIMFVFAYMFSAGIGLYWTLSTTLSFVQMVILHRVYNPAKAVAALKAKEEQDEATPLACVD